VRIIQKSQETVKTGQTQTRERIEYTRAGRLLSIVNTWSTMVNMLNELTKGRTRWKQTNTQRAGFYNENKPKEDHSLPKSRIASLAIRVSLIDPTAKNENPMIEDIQWSRLKAHGEHVRSLEASLPAYKYKASSLTEDDLLFFFSF
ncbi:hypothetical protein Tco_0863264, partial [Tanacetum coccineum]